MRPGGGTVFGGGQDLRAVAARIGPRPNNFGCRPSAYDRARLGGSCVLLGEHKPPLVCAFLNWTSARWESAQAADSRPYKGAGALARRVVAPHTMRACLAGNRHARRVPVPTPAGRRSGPLGRGRTNGAERMPGTAGRSGVQFVLTMAPPLGPGPKPWFSFRPLSQTRKRTPARERRPPEGLRLCKERGPRTSRRAAPQKPYFLIPVQPPGPRWSPAWRTASGTRSGPSAGGRPTWPSGPPG